MLTCLVTVWRKIFFCCYKDPLKEICEDTKLLPERKIKNPFEKKEIIFYGLVPEKYSENPLDLNSISNFSNYNVKKIVFGMNHCLIQFSNKKNELGIFGSNNHGQLGLNYELTHALDNEKENFNHFHEMSVECFELEGTIRYEILDIATTENFSIILINTEDYFTGFNKLRKLESISREEIKYDKISLIQQIYAREDRILLLTEDNSIYMYGKNFDMQILESYKCIVNKFEKKIKYLSIGNSFMLIFTGKFILILIDDQSLYAMGINEYGELCIPDSKNVSTPTQITYFQEKNLRIKQVTTGSRHTLVLCENDKLYAFGDNTEAQCTGKSLMYSEPIKIKLEGKQKIVAIASGSNHNIALSQTGDLFTWGDTSSGKLGYHSYLSKQDTPKEIPFLKLKHFSLLALGPMQTALVSCNFENSLSKDYSAIDKDETNK